MARLRKAAAGHMRWLTRNGVDYLHRKHRNAERSLGRRSREAEALMSQHKAARDRSKRTGTHLKSMARVNRALRLNRVPVPAVKVLRALDEVGWRTSRSVSYLTYYRRAQRETVTRKIDPLGSRERGHVRSASVVTLTSPSLGQSRLLHSIEVFDHRTRCVGHRLFDPGNGKVRLRLAI
jgi:hypothetical protein